MELLNIFRRPSWPDIVCLGDSFVDELIQGASSRLSPEAPVPVVDVRVAHSQEGDRVDRDTVWTWGGAGHVAATLHSALGVPVTLWMPLNSPSENLKSADFKLICGRHRERPGEDWHYKTRVFCNGQQVVRLNRTCRNYYPWTESATLKASRLKDCHVLCSDYGAGSVPSRSWQSLRRACQKLAIDSRKPNVAEMSRAWLWKANAQEFRDAENAMRGSEIEYILKTDGKDGLSLLSHGIQISPPRRYEVFDVCGAGDVAFALCSAGLAVGLEPQDAAFLAACGAGLAVTKIGTVPLTAAELESEVRRHLGPPGKIYREDELAYKADRFAGCVFVNGCFDPLHVGHMALLRAAKEAAKGKPLVVAVNSNRSVTQLKHECMLPVWERMNAVGSLSYVDAVVEFDGEVPPLIAALKPELYMVGSDHEDHPDVKSAVEWGAGEVRLFQREYGELSSTGIRGLM